MNVLPPVRVRREHTQNLVAPPDAVFPMLCPVREVEWVTGWDPYAVHSVTGVAEQDCVFVTRDDGVESTWVITEYDPEKHRIEFIKLTPGVTVAKLEFAVEPDGDAASKMHVAYTRTALSQEGRKAVAAFDEEYWAEFMSRMERELNHYLGMGDGTDDVGHRYQ